MWSAADGDVDGVDIPASQNVRATYPIARVAASEHVEAAQAFIDLVLSAAGRQTLLEAGFLPPADE